MCVTCSQEVLPQIPASVFQSLFCPEIVPSFKPGDPNLNFLHSSLLCGGENTLRFTLATLAFLLIRSHDHHAIQNNISGEEEALRSAIYHHWTRSLNVSRAFVYSITPDIEMSRLPLPRHLPRVHDSAPKMLAFPFQDGQSRMNRCLQFPQASRLSLLDGWRTVVGCSLL